MVYVIDSESSPYNHPNWRDGVRIGPVDEDRVTGFIPPFERDDRVYQGTACQIASNRDPLSRPIMTPSGCENLGWESCSNLMRMCRCWRNVGRA